MTQRPHRLALRFTPTAWTPTASGDFQQLQALAKAAQLVKDQPALRLLLGDPTIVIPAEIWQRVEVQMIDDGPRTILEVLMARWQEVPIKVEDPIDTIDAMGRTARFQDAALEALHRRVDDRDATISALGEQLERLHAELATAQADLKVEEDKVANLSAELARRLQRDAEHDAEAQAFEPDNGRALARLEADVASIVADTAIAVLDALAPHPPAEIGAAVDLHRVRVMIHHDVVRVVVADDLDPEVLEHIEVEVGDKIGDRLGLDSSVVVQAEPGQPAPGFIVRGGVAGSAEAPTLRWYWRHKDEAIEVEEHGPLDSEAAAVDATWDQHAEDAREYQGEDER